MATIKNAKTLLKRITLANLISDNNLYMTPLLNGPHGIGKSQIVKEAAADLDGTHLLIEGGLLREGEIGGLPFATQGLNGTTEVRFVRYHIINQIYQLQKFYYQILTEKGFLDGNVRIEKRESDGKLIFHDFDREIEMADEEQVIINGEDNRYNIDCYLSQETRLKLIESGEVKPVLVMIDEINRTDNMTQREIMNILLNHEVNGFNLPWFAQFIGACNPSSQNSSYATNEFDPAQMSRMCNIKVSADISEWVEYAITKNFASDIVEGLSVAEGIFIQKDSSTEDRTEMTPDPRAWEMLSHFYATAELLNSTKFFSDEERKELSSDIRRIMAGKVGDTAARTLLETIANRENNIKPAEILTGKDSKVDKEVVAKFQRLKSLTKWVIANNVILHLYNISPKLQAEKTKTDKKDYVKNIYAQFADFLLLLDRPTQILIVKKSLTLGGNMKFYTTIAPSFAKDVIKSITDIQSAVNTLTEQ